jgi:hypothetical protein
VNLNLSGCISRKKNEEDQRLNVQLVFKIKILWKKSENMTQNIYDIEIFFQLSISENY